MRRAKNGKDKNPWTEAKNAQRCALIDKEIDGQLTPAVALELEDLQQQMLRHRRRVAPFPLEEPRQLYQELLAKAEAARRVQGESSGTD